MAPAGFNRVVFDAKQLLRPAAALRYRELLSHADWSPQAIREFSVQRMRDVVDHAACASPFYEEHLGHRTDDLQVLPLLKRKHLAERFDDIRARNVPLRRGRVATTTGSTGAPARVIHDKACHSEAVGWRIMKTWGVHPGDNVAVLNRQNRSRIAAMANRAKWFPTRRVMIDAARMAPEDMSQFAENMNKVRPRVFVGYAGALLAFAGHLESKGLSIPAPDVVWATASPLTDHQRRYLGEVFGGPVFDQYGAGEVPWIAAECRYHQGLHVQSDTVMVEVLDDDCAPVPPGTWGRIVVTDLYNYLFPLIRYDLGDVGRFLDGDCPCGSPFPRLDHIQGRVVDVFRFADGTVLAGSLASIFNDGTGVVRQFRLHQISFEQINMYCVPRDTHGDTLASIERVRDELALRIGNKATVHLKLVDSLDHFRGKTRFVISDVPGPGA